MKFPVSASRLQRRLLLFLTSFLFITSAIAANPSSTFIRHDDQGSNVTISVNVPANSTQNDIFFHVSAPSGHAWVGFAFGEKMIGALMLVAYPSEDGRNVTISPRLGIKYAQPMYTDAFEVKVLDGTYVDDDVYHINAQCINCRSWPLASGGRAEIDVKSTAQPMVYALGSEAQSFESDSPEATIKGHMAFGRFLIDLRAATGEGGVPTNTLTQSGVSHLVRSGESRLGTIFHGLIMSACFVVFLPLGALLIRLPLGLAFWLHLVWQCCTTVCIMVGFSLGIYISIKNKRSPQLKSAHQGLGITVFLLVLGQASLGFLLHHTYRKSQSPSVHGKIHRVFGISIILLGVTNGVLGIYFSNNTARLPPYFGVVVFITIICMLSQCIFRRRTMRKKALNSAAAHNFRAAAWNVPMRNYGGRDNLSEQSFAHVKVETKVYVEVMPKNEEQRMS